MRGVRGIRMPFGKFKGEPLRLVPEDYLTWAEGIAQLPSLRRAIRAELDHRRAEATFQGNVAAIKAARAHDSGWPRNWRGGQRGGSGHGETDG